MSFTDPARHCTPQVCEKCDHVVSVEGVVLAVAGRLPSGEMALMAERWSRVHHSRRMGVWLTGAWVRTTLGIGILLV
jgi:hypothetical protein